MFSHFKNRRELPEDDDDLNITAMIDVVLLLLIFFMITSNMQQFTTLEPPVAIHGTNISVDQSIVLSVFKTDHTPEIYLGDHRENGPATPEEITAYIQSGVAAMKRNIIIKADRDLPSIVVEDLARSAAVVDSDLTYYVGVIDRPR
ncbi:ExbD/TolR family protein [Planctomicrobium sp. SH668]|uniref:ExbD/TolR family protein n=1 Tax=Planctomicrobium sp. SH668 TaxID=3448126 RepID=UPI003F5C4894